MEKFPNTFGLKCMKCMEFLIVKFIGEVCLRIVVKARGCFLVALARLENVWVYVIEEGDGKSTGIKIDREKWYRAKAMQVKEYNSKYNYHRKLGVRNVLACAVNV